MTTTSLRVRESVRAHAASLAEREGVSIGDIVERALDAYETALFWQQTQLALVTAPANDDMWDTTTRDGLTRG